MTTYRLTIAYDGRYFKGWQRHPGQATVQGALEAALLEISGIRANVEGSGRTDAGTHADAQVASVTLPDHAPLGDLAQALPEGLQLLAASPEADDFHARMDSTGKTYRYEIWNAPKCPADRMGRVWHIPGPLDVDAMRLACPLFVGELDFASFAKRPNFERATTVRRVKRVDLSFETPTITITMHADSFLYKMVRNVVRTIVKVGEGRVQPQEIANIFAAKNRNAAPGTAPASGLYLQEVHY